MFTLAVLVDFLYVRGVSKNALFPEGPTPIRRHGESEQHRSQQCGDSLMMSDLVGPLY